jgi:hypothetical protein
MNIRIEGQVARDVMKRLARRVIRMNPTKSNIREKRIAGKAEDCIPASNMAWWSERTDELHIHIYT